VKARRSLLTLLGVAALLGWAAPAAAHAVLVSSSPASGATVTSPATVSLTFDDKLLDIGARISVLDARGGDHAAGAAYFPVPTTVQVNVGPLDPGEYTAEWRVVADDGHPIEGTLPFTVVAPAAGPSASRQGAAPVSNTAAAGSTGRVYVTIAVTLAAIALIAAGVFFLVPKDPATGSRRRRALR